ncbi:hypothetical protein BBK82_05115 [Lentzea guizhouensis]|uniref:Exonuclease domain-containing protein n=1 Tax=Lentzea guizhouensis TaxID=1586287 RepID=A0A1B2HCV8_9PSEU|nr:exonuclease domain-containing protein [Lentzea guizhouensis]ANZ35553.1 hypothetical protein BBK82_05115 [Lentzea guizhouensis]
MPDPRQIVVVDVETSGLDPAQHIAVEVAWVNLATGEHDVFVPPHNWRDVLVTADLRALRINGYLDRLVEAEQDRHGQAARALWDQLDGNTLAGCNPSFDAVFLRKMFDTVYDLDDHNIDGPPTWHHRLLDLSAYAAGALGIEPHELPGLSTVCERLGVEHPDAHTAFGDADATYACFLKLLDMQVVGRA